MANDYLYVPILKGKQGELEGLNSSEPEIRRGFTPLIEVPPIPPRYVEGQEEPVPAKSIDEHVASFAPKLASAWGTTAPLFLDGQNVEEEDQLQNGTEPIAAILSALRAESVRVIPVTGLDRVAEYQLAVKAAVGEGDEGCCLRLTEAALESLSDLEPQINSLLQLLETEPRHTDLLLDFGPNVPSRAAIPYQIAAIPMLDAWRTFTLASSSFPANLSNIKQNSLAELERGEWELWTFLRSQRRAVRRLPRFSDYAINHPELFEVDPRIMRMSPNIRYTGELVFVVAKGQAYRRKKERKKSVPPDKQYPKLAKMIMNHREWRGAGFSAGDTFIEQCARGERVGNPTNWRAVGTVHHLAFVVRQLANLP